MAHLKKASSGHLLKRPASGHLVKACAEAVSGVCVCGTVTVSVDVTPCGDLVGIAVDVTEALDTSMMEDPTTCGYWAYPGGLTNWELFWFSYDKVGGAAECGGETDPLSPISGSFVLTGTLSCDDGTPMGVLSGTLKKVDHSTTPPTETDCGTVTVTFS